MLSIKLLPLLLSLLSSRSHFGLHRRVMSRQERLGSSQRKHSHLVQKAKSVETGRHQNGAEMRHLRRRNARQGNQAQGIFGSWCVILPVLRRVSALLQFVLHPKIPIPFSLIRILVYRYIAYGDRGQDLRGE